MAIQPIALQGAINQSTQISGVQLQADLAPQTFQMMLAAEFASRVVFRSETVHHARKLLGRMTPGRWTSAGKPRKAKRLFAALGPERGRLINVLA